MGETRERPILFSGAMVRAILDGRKSQTRRAVRAETATDGTSIIRLVGSQSFIKLAETGLVWTPFGGSPDVPWPAERLGEVCSYGKPGDRLWVREEHYRLGHWEPVHGVKTRGGRMKWQFVPDSAEVLFEPPPTFRKGRHHKDPATPAWHKRLARFMPRALGRLTLEVVSVRVERLHDMSEEDAKAEGIALNPVQEGTWMNYPERSSAAGWRDPRESFRTLWESINGAASWAANPWVWVVEFKRVEVAHVP